MRVVGPAPMGGDFIELVMDEPPLRKAMLRHSVNLLLLSLLVTGIAAAYYPSGQRTNVRPVTVWIDAETQLVRKVLEDTPKGYPAGSYLRITTTYEPQGNPTLDDRKFQFSVPQ